MPDSTSMTNKMTQILPNIRRGLRKRWMFGSVLVTAACVFFVVITFSAFFYSYYYSAVRAGLEAKALTTTNFFATYVTSSFYEYHNAAQRYTNTFADRDRLELQFMSVDGKIITSSIGIPTGTVATTSDVREAVENKRIAVWVGKRPLTGERVMSVSAPMIVSDGQVVGVMRYITSLQKVDRQVFFSILMVVGAGLLVMLIVVAVNIMYVRAVIAPVGAITRLSRHIANGSYGTLIENEYRDEIGEMVMAINEMSAKIAQVEKMKTEFISSISHELRTPLTAITGWGETLSYNDKLDDDTLLGINIILKEARRLTNMVEELLEFTRIEDGRFTVNIEMFDIAAELEDTIYALREMLNRDELELRYFPGEEKIPLIPGDPDRIKQVFWILLDNAAKYGRAGRYIDVEIKPDDAGVAVSVRDYGPGVPEDELPKITQKFYKGSGSKERGSGIGLAVCEEIVRYHGGRLIIENVTEQIVDAERTAGLRVTVLLPMTNTAELGEAP